MGSGTQKQGVSLMAVVRGEKEKKKKKKKMLLHQQAMELGWEKRLEKKKMLMRT